MTTLDQFLAGVVLDCVEMREAIHERAQLDIAADGPAAEPPTFTGAQADADVRAVQLRPDHFSEAMIEKAGRLYHIGYRTHGPEDFEVCGEHAWYHVRVFGERTWFATCDCPARASRWNRAGACAHRALGGYLRAQLLGVPIPRWPSLNLEGETS